MTKPKLRENQTYDERNTLMIALARTMLLLGYKAGYGVDEERSGWDIDWRTVVYVDLPDGAQLSYHMNPDTAEAARTLPVYDGKWDGGFTGRDVPDWLISMRDVTGDLKSNIDRYVEQLDDDKPYRDSNHSQRSLAKEELDLFSSFLKKEQTK